MRGKVFVLLFFAAALLCGCKDPDLIGKKDMVPIYRDLLYADGYVDSQPNLRAQTDSLYLYVPIIEKYGYTKEQFLYSIDYYLRNSGDFVDIIKQVKAAIESDMLLLEAEHTALEEAETETESITEPAEIAEKDEDEKVEKLEKAVLPDGRPVERKLNVNELKKLKTKR